MKELKNDIVLCRNNDQIFSDIDGEVVMLNISNSEYYNLNSVASVIWNYFDKPKSLNSLFRVLQEKFEVSKDLCEEETKQFISNLYEKGLLRVVDEDI